YPQALVALGFSEALKSAKISLPDYLGIAIELDGQPIQLPAPWNKLGDVKLAGDTLAEGHFQMPQEGEIPMTDSNSELNAQLLARPGSRQEGNNIIFDTLPSRPQFSMKILLTDRK